MTETPTPDEVLDSNDPAADDAVAAEEELEAVDEGEVAADYLEELLDIADLDGDIEIEVRDGRTYLSVIAEEKGALDMLVGNDGDVLAALQELTRLAVLAETGERSRLILDIAGHRAERGQRLRRLAEEAVQEVRETGDSVALEPMTAYERKQVHDVVAEAGLASESEGEGAERHVVVLAP